MNAELVAITIFSCVEVELKNDVPLELKIDVELAYQFPANVIWLDPILKIELVAVPSCLKPVGR